MAQKLQKVIKMEHEFKVGDEVIYTNKDSTSYLAPNYRYVITEVGLGVIRIGADLRWHRPCDFEPAPPIFQQAPISPKEFETAYDEPQERYADEAGDDWIDEFARTKTIEEFRSAMEFTIGKYLRRLGKKDESLLEVRKIADYANRWLKYEESHI